MPLRLITSTHWKNKPDYVTPLLKHLSVVYRLESLIHFPVLSLNVPLQIPSPTEVGLPSPLHTPQPSLTLSHCFSSRLSLVSLYSSSKAVLLLEGISFRKTFLTSQTALDTSFFTFSCQFLFIFLLHDLKCVVIFAYGSVTKRSQFSAVFNESTGKGLRGKMGRFWGTILLLFINEGLT